MPTQTREVAQAILSGRDIISEISPLFNAVTNDPSKPKEEIKSDLVDKKPFAQLETVAKTVKEVIVPKKKDPVIANDNTLTTANIIDATNKERIAKGFLPLTPNEKLTASAKLKTEDMIKNNYFEHVSPKGVTVSDLGNSVGYNYVIMGENLAVGNFTGADDLVTAWMNSPGHRANILNTSYLEVGIFAAQGEYQGRKVWFAVQHFGTTRGACPVVSQSLKSDIDVFNQSLRKQEREIVILRAQLEATTDKTSESYGAQVVAFNALVATYNIELAASQQSIAHYNKQVVAFNNCLSKYQGTQ